MRHFNWGTDNNNAATALYILVCLGNREICTKPYVVALNLQLLIFQNLNYFTLTERAWTTCWCSANIATFIEMRLLILNLQHPERYLELISLNKTPSSDACVDEFINQIKLHMNGLNYWALCDVIIKNRNNEIYNIWKISYYIHIYVCIYIWLCNGSLKNQFRLHPFLFFTQCAIYICNEHDPVIIGVIGIEIQCEGGLAHKRDINTIALVVSSQRRHKKETIKRNRSCAVPWL
jgi:hypothetical protein